MYFVEFYNSLADENSACGDRAVLILDGRESLFNHRKHAKDWAHKHGFKAYEIRRGDSFTRSQIIAEKIGI